MSETKKSGIDYWKQIVVVMSLGWVAIWIYRTVLTPIYPEIQASLDNVSNAEIGAIASFYFFAYCSMQIPCGILVDKFGQATLRKRKSKPKPLRKMRNAHLYSLVYCVAFTSSISVPATVII